MKFISTAYFRCSRREARASDRPWPSDGIGIASVACVLGVAACFAFAGPGRASVGAGGIPTEEAQLVLDTSASVEVEYRLEALRAIAVVVAGSPPPVPARRRERVTRRNRWLEPVASVEGGSQADRRRVTF